MFVPYSCKHMFDGLRHPNSAPHCVGNVIGYPAADRQHELERLTAELDRRIERRLIPLEDGRRVSDEVLPMIAEQLTALDRLVNEIKPPA
jgi:hypothetical protein